jgi:DNA-binding CsgD family transcriptional regulator/tetratricopeptide (TPR) repeat protein
LVERDAALEVLSQLLGRARHGRGGAVFVVAGAGLGKTTVLDQGCKLAAPFARVGAAQGDVMESSLAFGMMTALFDDLGAPGLPEHMDKRRSADDAQASHFYRRLGWLEEISAGGPVVLAIDDLHWSDPDSLRLLSYLCRRISRMPVAVIATLRPWPPGTEEVCQRLARAGHAVIERLAPLTEDGIRRFLGGRVPALSPAMWAWIGSSSAGNPLLLEQVALAVGRGEAMKPSLDGLFLGRFAGLPEAGLLCARAGAVLGVRFRPDLAVALAGLDENQAELALEALAHSGLVRQTGAGLAEFTHPLFFQGLYDDLSPLVRDGLHAQAFRLLLERGLEAEAAEHAVKGHLVGNAEAVAVLARVGRVALRAGAVAIAARRLENAVALAGDRAPVDVLLLLGEALVADGEIDRAIAAYRHILERPDVASGTATEALRMLGRALFLNGELVPGERRFEEAVALARANRPEVAVEALLDLSRAAWLTAGPAGALPVASRARELADRADDTSRTQAEAAWGFVAFVSGDPAGLEATERAGRMAMAHGDPVLRDLSWSWGTLRNLGRAAKYAERFAEAEAIFDVTFGQAERAGSPHAMASLAAHHADSLVRQGRLEEALALAGRALALAELAPMAGGFAHAVEALLLLHLDRPEESEASCRRAEQVAVAQGQWLPLLRAWHVRALRLLREGDHEEASGLYSRLGAESARLKIGEPCLVPWARAAVGAHLGRGRPDEAEAVLAWLAGPAYALPCRWPRIAAHAGRAAQAEAANDRDGAESHLRAALALHDEVDLPLERVETLLQWGSFLRRAGRVADARDALRQAMTLTDATGATWLGRSVAEELAVAGGRRSRRAAPDALTPQEGRVAALAGTGRSSREIAGQLSLSVRTVETHLHRVYAKLGIHSQRELMARMSPGPKVT